MLVLVFGAGLRLEGGSILFSRVFMIELAESLSEFRFSGRPAAAPVFPTGDIDLAERLLREGPFELGESYVRGEWDAEGLDEVMLHVFSDGRKRPVLAHRLRMLGYLIRNRLSRLKRGRRAFKAARAHYDLGDDLFYAMLDSTLSYTCGYWNGARTLEEAQLSKLDLVCRKLELQSGMHVLDFSCGWGNFAEFAARRYGVRVTGVTTSREHAALARERCAGMPVEILLQDYRKIGGLFDRAVSIGMIEAVGRRRLGTFYGTSARVLRPGGLLLVEAISGETGSHYSSGRVDELLVWISRYIFPNGYLPKLKELVAPARDLFVLEDLFGFGPDYDRTLMAWTQNFDKNYEGLSGRYDERFRRCWRFFLLSSAALFRARLMHVYQVLYRKR